MRKNQWHFRHTILIFTIALSVGACETADQRILDSADQFENNLQQGKTLHEKGNLEEALTHFQQAVALKPFSDEIHYLIGLVYYKKYLQSHDMAGKRHTQEQLADEQLRLQEELSQLSHEEWEQLYEKKYGLRSDYKVRALKEFAQTLALNPGNWWARYHIAVDHLGSGRFNEAIREYKEVIRSNPQLGISYSGLGNAYHNLGKYDLAISNYKKAISLSNEMTTIDLDLARAYLETGQKEKAIRIYEEMKKENHILTYSLQLLIDDYSQ